MKADRRGFILPTSLLVMTLLTVMLTAAFVMVSAEYRSSDNSMASTRALAIAQAGLQTYFSSNRNLRPSDWGDSVRYTFTNGYTDVVGRKMRDISTGVTQWIIKATGTTTDPLLTAQVTAKRTVAQMATLQPSSLPARAGLVALNGVQVLGTGTNPLSGNSWGSCAGAMDTTGLATVSGGYYTQYTGTSNPAPPGGIEALASVNALFDSTHIDWASIVAGNFTPDYIASSTNLPAPLNTTWEVGYTSGDLTLPGTGGFPYNQRSGVLVVGGNLTLGHGSHWDGIIIVGGWVRPASTSSEHIVHGMLISGLNCITSSCPGSNTFYRGGGGPTYRDIYWSYCWASKAVALLNTMQPRKNTFVDNWAAY